MQQPNDTKIFTGVMDTDSAPFNINQVDVRYRLNLINLYNDQGFGSNENIVSFLPLFNQFLTTATQKCLGCFEDVRGNSIIFFIYSADKKHGIYRWYQDKATNGVIEKIYQVQDVNNDCLNFQEDNLISHVSLVDELLIWTDGYNEPRCMNIVRANTTNKQRIFNLYFDQAAFVSAPATVYTLKVYTSTTQTFTWQSVSLTYVDRVQDFVNAVSATPSINQYIHVENKVNYAQITIVDIGDYMIEVTPSAYVVAENFYPDVTLTTYSYAPLNTELITAIKYPPMCSPEGTYTTNNGIGLFNIKYNEIIPIAPSQGPLRDWYQGISNDSTDNYYDTNNFIVPGPNEIPPIPQTQPLTFPSYIQNPYSNPYSVSLQFNFQFQILQGIDPTTHIYLVGIDSIGNIASGEELVNGIPYDGNQAFYSITVVKTITLMPNYKYVIQHTFNGEYVCNVDCYGFEANTGTLNLVNPLLNNIYQFRCRYVYKDNQISTMGAISAYPLSTSVSQNAIQIDYTDKRLEDVSLASDIRKVIMSVSNDNGVTWFDWKTIMPYEFIGVGRQKVLFTGNENLIPVDNAFSSLAYYNIPLKAKSQEYIDDRIFYGAITTGYDTIELDINYVFQYIPVPTNSYLNYPPYTSKSYWKRGGQYQIGIVYYDDADRKTGVILDNNQSNINIPTYNATQNLSAATIQLNINHEPPSWATKYQIVRTNELTQSNYLMWITDNITLDNTGNQSYLKISFANIVNYTDNVNVGAKIDFSYVDGDRIRFIMKRDGTYYYDNEFEIVRVDGTDVYIEVNNTVQYLTQASGQLVEIYSPKPKDEALIFYEFSECYEIKEANFFGINRKYHTGNVTNQWYNTFSYGGLPAVIDLEIGDVFYRFRQMTYNTYVPLPIGGYPVKTYFISSNTPTDKTELIGGSPYNNNGRPNITDLIGQLYQPTGVVFTNRYISNTKINGLNAVEPANIRQYSTIYGDLNCMRVLNNDILRLIFANGYQLSIYVNQGVIRQSGGGINLVSIYDDVAGNSHIIQKTLGTLNAESCVINDEGDLFGWDETEGVEWLSASNSLVQVSEYKMMNVFNEYGQTRRQLDRKKSHTPAVYDLSRDLMVLTLNNLQPQPYIAPSFIVKLPDLTNVSLWEYKIDIHPNNLSYYEFNPSSTSWYDLFANSLAQLGQFTLTQNADGSFKVEAPSFVGYNNSVLVLSAYSKLKDKFYTYSYSFLGGQQASDLSSFSGVTIAYNRKQQGWQTYFSYLPEMYGRLRNQIISFDNGVLYLHDRGVGYNNFYGQQYGSKINFILNKDYPKVKTPLSLWYRGKGNWSAKVGYSPNNMETQMLPANWRLQENGYSTEVLRDKNDPAFTNQFDAWVNGQEIRGDYIEIELSNDENTFAAIDSEKTIYTYSEIS